MRLNESFPLVDVNFLIERRNDIVSLTMSKCIVTCFFCFESSVYERKTQRRINHLRTPSEHFCVMRTKLIVIVFIN